MGNHQKKVTLKSGCFEWLKSLISSNIDEFYFRDLPQSLKDNRMLHRSASSRLLTVVKTDNNGVRKWKVNKFEISKIEKEILK